VISDIHGVSYKDTREDDEVNAGNETSFYSLSNVTKNMLCFFLLVYRGGLRCAFCVFVPYLICTIEPYITGLLCSRIFYIVVWKLTVCLSSGRHRDFRFSLASFFPFLIVLSFLRRSCCLTPFLLSWIVPSILYQSLLMIVKQPITVCCFHQIRIPTVSPSFPVSHIFYNLLH
jgi:hypothetical protein